MTAVVVRADARALPLADGCADLIVTSPPYFRLRDYQDGGVSLAGQIGAEDDPDDYLDALLECTAEWLRVLRPGGSLWVNLGDKRSDRAGTRNDRHPGEINGPARRSRPRRPNTIGMAPRGSRLMLPERYALGCVDELGLSVRQFVVWDKPSAMPESVRDRCRDTHEYLYHFVRPGRYYSAVDRIREPHASSSIGRAAPHRAPTGVLHPETDGAHRMDAHTTVHPLGALPGTVWRIPTAGLDVPDELEADHYAAFPPALARRIVLGWSPERRCIDCGEGLTPVVDRPEYGGYDDDGGDRMSGGRRQNSAARSRKWRERVASGRLARIVGETCACPPGLAGETVPGLVVDPFGGSGTVALVADTHGRDGVSADLSHDYGRIATWRTRDETERARARQLPPPRRQADGQEMLFGELV